MPHDSLGDVVVCADCGAPVRNAYIEGMGILALDAEPRRSADVDVLTHPLSWGWRGFYGYFVTRVVGRGDPDECTYVAHPCGVKERKRGQVDNPFGTPRAPGASGPSMQQLKDRLVLIDVLAIERGIVTPSGVADGARVNLVDLGTGDVFRGMMLWGKVLLTQIDPGSKYVGRVVQGEPQPGKSPAWNWQPGSESEHQDALAHLPKLAGVAQPTTSAPAQDQQPASAATSGAPW